MRTVLRWILIAIVVVAILLSAVIWWRYHHRPGLGEYRAHIHPPATREELDSGALTAKWFGTTALLVSDGESTIFIDPFFTRPAGWLNMMSNRQIEPDESLIKSWLEKIGISRLDAVMVSHSHYDHAMDAGIVARMTGARLIGSESTAQIGRGAGLPEDQIVVASPDTDMISGNFMFRMIESRHAGKTGGRPTGKINAPLVPPARYTDYKQGGTYSFLIQHDRGTFLHHGSAGWRDGMFEEIRADVVFLGIAARPSISRYMSAVVDPVGATRVIPMHWDDFARPLDQELLPLPFGGNLDEFFNDMARARPNIRVQTLELGIPVAIFPGRTEPVDDPHGEMEMAPESLQPLAQ